MTPTFEPTSSGAPNRMLGRGTGRTLRHAGIGGVAGADRGRLALLTPREREVYECLRLGYSQGEIARAFGISVHTARWHARRVRRKLEPKSPTGSNPGRRAANDQRG